jgi:hypothetical protein
LRTSWVAAITESTATDTFSGFDVGCSPAPDSCLLANAEEGSVTWVGPADPGVRQVSIVVASGDNLLLVSRSPTGTYFCQATSGGSTAQGTAPTFSSLDTVPECVGGW